MCVVKEYRYYTISLSKYHGWCQYHKSHVKKGQTSSIKVKNGQEWSIRSKTVNMVKPKKKKKKKMGKTTVKKGPTLSLKAKNGLETVSYCLFFLN
jgi:hypothetical protein